jgi:hypothetical protein
MICRVTIARSGNEVETQPETGRRCFMSVLWIQGSLNRTLGADPLDNACASITRCICQDSHVVIYSKQEACLYLIPPTTPPQLPRHEVVQALHISYHHLTGTHPDESNCRQTEGAPQQIHKVVLLLVLELLRLRSNSALNAGSTDDRLGQAGVEHMSVRQAIQSFDGDRESGVTEKPEAYKAGAERAVLILVSAGPTLYVRPD